jgi:hypothetical protein
MRVFGFAFLLKKGNTCTFNHNRIYTTNNLKFILHLHIAKQKREQITKKTFTQMAGNKYYLCPILEDILDRQTRLPITSQIYYS